MKADETTVLPPPNIPSSTIPYPNGSGGIDPFKSYQQCFNGEITASKNPEFIFTRQSYTGSDLNDIAKHAAPRQMNGWNTIAATLKQEKAYLMCDGNPITSPSAEYPYRPKDSLSPIRIIRISVRMFLCAMLIGNLVCMHRWHITVVYGRTEVQRKHRK